MWEIIIYIVINDKRQISPNILPEILTQNISIKNIIFIT